MSIGIVKPWRALHDDHGEAIPPTLGVFELADEDGNSLFVGYAGGHSLFGLRSEIPEAAAKVPGASKFRFEVTAQYLSRLKELRMAADEQRG